MASRSLGQLTIDLIAKVGGFVDGMDKAGKSAAGAAKKTSSSMRDMSADVKKFAGIMATALATVGLGFSVKNIINEQEKLQRNMLRTEQLVRSTGAAAGFNAEQLHEQARGLAFATLQSTEGVMAAQQVMLSFRKVSGDTFTRSIELAADLATVTGVDLKSSVTQLGKALEDPVTGINAMTRSGVSFTQGQKDMIKSMVEAGDVASAQTLILDELAQQYGGVAKAEAMGLAGAYDTLAQSNQEAKIALADYFGLGEKNAGVIYALAIEVQAMTGAFLGSGESATSAANDYAGLHEVLGGLFNLATIAAVEFEDFGDAIGYSAARTKLLVERDIALRTFQYDEAERLNRQIIAMDNDRAASREGAEQRIIDAIANRESASAKLRAELAQAQKEAAAVRLNGDIETLIKNTELFGFAQDEAAVSGEKFAMTIEEIVAGMGAEIKQFSAQETALKKSQTEQQKLIDQQLERERISAGLVDDVEHENSVLQRQLAVVGLGEAAQDALNRELYLENIIRSDAYQNVLPQHRAAYLQQIATQYDLTAALSDQREEQDRVAQAAADAAEETTRVWQEATDRINEVVSDGWTRTWESLFEGTKVDFDDLAETLKSGFYRLLGELSHMALTRPIMLAIGGGGSVNASAGELGGGGSFDLSSLMSLSNLSSTLTTGLAALGGTLAKVLPAAMTQSFTQTGFSVISDAAFESAVMQGGLNQGWNMAAGAGSLLTAGAGIIGGYGGTMLGESLIGKEAESPYGAAAGAAAGAYIGSIVPGIGNIVGALVGGIIGGIVDVASGGDGNQRYALGVSTNPDWRPTEHATLQQTAASGLTLTSYQKRTGEDGNAVAEQMTQALLATDAALTGFFESLGITVDLAGQMLDGKASQFGEAVDGFFGAAGYNGLNPEDLAGAVDEFVFAWVDRVNEITKSAIDLQPLIDIQREGELLADVLIRVYSQFSSINSVLDAVGLATYDVSVSGMAAADGLVALFGSLENFQAGFAKYYELFYTEQEKVAAVGEQVNAVFAALNITAPTTIDGFRELVDVYGNMGVEGQATLAALIGIAPAFHQVATSAEAAAAAAAELAAAQQAQAAAAEAAARAAQINTASDIADTILQQYQDREKTIASLRAQMTAIDEQILNVQDQIFDATNPVAETINEIAVSVDNLGVSSSQLRSIADNLIGTVNSLRLGNLSPLNSAARLEEALSQYRQAQQAAAGGDASGLAAAANAYLQQAAAYYASSPAYVSIFDDVTGYLADMGAELDVQADAAERAERIAEQQRAALAAIQTSTAETVDTTKLYGDLDKLLQERQLIEQQLANLTAISSQDILTGQLDRLTEMVTGIDGLTGLLGLLPSAIADGLAGVLGLAIESYRALTPTEAFFAGGDMPEFADGGIATGPTSGYPVTLHGTEAVIPLNGGAVPVQIDNSALVAEVRTLRTELQAIKGELSEGNGQRSVVITETRGVRRDIKSPTPTIPGNKKG